jgi:hypothetical protein
MTSETRTTVELTDFESAVITCGARDCGTKVVVDLESSQTAPRSCPTCGSMFEADPYNRFKELLALLRSFTRAPLPVELIVKKPVESPASTPPVKSSVRR